MLLLVSNFAPSLGLAAGISLSAYTWHRSSRFLGIGPCLSVPRFPERFSISRVACELAFQPLEPDPELDFFIPSMGNFIHLGALKRLKNDPIVWIFLHEPNAGAA